MRDLSLNTKRNLILMLGVFGGGTVPCVRSGN